MLFVLLRTRIRALVVTLLIGLAAPRIARVLRGFGQRRSRAGGGLLTTTVPLEAADLLDKVAIWARPPRKERRRRR
ncbi:MAG: hypothetical protein ACJ73E_05150 [Mycobacteriales bacterium]